MPSFLNGPASAHALQVTTKTPKLQTAPIFANSSVASVWEGPNIMLIIQLANVLKIAQLILMGISKPSNASKFVTLVPSDKRSQAKGFA